MLHRVRERIHPAELVVAKTLPATMPQRFHPPITATESLAWMRAQDRRASRDPYRYDPNRLLPASALVRQVRVGHIVIEAPQSVAELCASAGLAYAQRHIAAELAPSGAKAGC